MNKNEFNRLQKLAGILTEDELNSDDLMAMGNFIKNTVMPEIQKNAEVIDMHTKLLKEQADFIRELAETVQDLSNGSAPRTIN